MLYCVQSPEQEANTAKRNSRNWTWSWERSF